MRFLCALLALGAAVLCTATVCPPGCDPHQGAYTPVCDSVGKCTSCNAGLWGDQCDKSCASGCNPRTGAYTPICDRDTGVCSSCKQNAYGHADVWGHLCDKPCSADCHTNPGTYDPVCDRETGICTVCKENAYDRVARWGSNCQHECSADCHPNTGAYVPVCDRETGICSVCKENAYDHVARWGSNCQNECGENCNPDPQAYSPVCARNSGVCSSCKGATNGEPGWWGEDCRERCGEGCTTSCDATTGACASCSSDFWGADCGARCSNLCEPNNPLEYNPPRVCNAQTGVCAHCKSGWGGVRCWYNKLHCEACQALLSKVYSTLTFKGVDCDEVVDLVGGGCLSTDALSVVFTGGTDTPVAIPAAVGCLAAGTAVRHACEEAFPTTPAVITQLIHRAAAHTCQHTGACHTAPVGTRGHEDAARSALRGVDPGAEPRSNTVTAPKGWPNNFTALGATLVVTATNVTQPHKFRFKASESQGRSTLAAVGAVGAETPSFLTMALAMDCSVGGGDIARVWGNGTCLVVGGSGPCRVQQPLFQFVNSIVTAVVGPGVTLAPAGHGVVAGKAGEVWSCASASGRLEIAFAPTGTPLALTAAVNATQMSIAFSSVSSSEPSFDKDLCNEALASLVVVTSTAPAHSHHGLPSSAIAAIVVATLLVVVAVVGVVWHRRRTPQSWLHGRELTPLSAGLLANTEAE